MLKQSFACLVICAAAWPVAAHAQSATPDELIAALKGGGHVAYIRHASTERDYADQVDADPNNCATQRTLSEAGWQEAKAIGAGFRANDIPVGDVIASQYCRAWKTADLAFGMYTRDPALNFEPAEEYTDAQMAAMRDRVLPIVSAPVDMGTNRIVVGHDDPFEAVTGIYPEPMGVTYVLRPTGESFEVLGALPPSVWSD